MRKRQVGGERAYQENNKDRSRGLLADSMVSKRSRLEIICFQSSMASFICSFSWIFSIILRSSRKRGLVVALEPTVEERGVFIGDAMPIEAVGLFLFLERVALLVTPAVLAEGTGRAALVLVVAVLLPDSLLWGTAGLASGASSERMSWGPDLRADSAASILGNVGLIGLGRLSRISFLNGVGG